MSSNNIGTVEVSEVLRFQSRRILTNMFKSCLVILEDLAVEHDESMGKLSEALPTELKPFVTLADYFSEVKSETLRAKVLSAGNNAIREMEEQLSHYEISLKQPKN